MSSFNTSQFDPEGRLLPERNDGSGNLESELLTFSFHGSYIDEDKKRFENVQNSDLKRICSYLQVNTSLVSGIRYEVFDTREQKQLVDPNHSISRVSARFREFSIYRFWLPPENSSFPHELTHLVAHRWTEPYLFETELDTADGRKINRAIEMVSTSFMQEGLAIAVDEILFSRMLTENGVTRWVDDFCRDQEKELPNSLADVINIEGFGNFPNQLVVPFSASFSKFLIADYGLPKYKQMYVKVRETLSPKENVNIIEDVYGIDEVRLLDLWKSTICGYSLD